MNRPAPLPTSNLVAFERRVISRVGVLVALALLAGGCGGGEDRPDAPTRTQEAAQTGVSDAVCAEAKRLIADLPKPEDADGDADYADQAADALEKVDSPAVKALRDVELAAIEVRARAFNRAAGRLERAGGECGEKEAARVLLPISYVFALRDAIDDHNRKSRRAPDELVASLRFEARRYVKLTARVEELVVPEQVRAEHARFLDLLRQSVRFYRRTAAAPATWTGAASKRIDAQRDRAAHRLQRKLNRING